MGVLSLTEFVKKSAWTPAQTLGLQEKGSISAGSDADIAVVDRCTKSVVSTVASGEVVFHRGTVIPRSPRLLATERASARLPGARTIDPATSGLYTGAGR
jgi:dihydroorotase-like cyclic amidohydrolase